MFDALSAASARVPAEFVGLARCFRDAVKAEDRALAAALDRICIPLRARLARKPTLRREMLPEIARGYDAMVPTRFRIGEVQGVHFKADFAITERRLSVSWLSCGDWDDHETREPGVTVTNFTFSMFGGRLRRRVKPLANASLHALARRIERGRDKTHAALLADLARLAGDGGEGDRVPTPGGAWLGDLITAGEGGPDREVRIRNVRTWLPDGT